MDHDLTKNGDAAPDQDPVELAAQEAVKRALLQQKRLGNPIVVWENGQVRWIPADEIDVDRECPPAQNG